MNVSTGLLGGFLFFIFIFASCTISIFHIVCALAMGPGHAEFVHFIFPSMLTGVEFCFAVSQTWMISDPMKGSCSLFLQNDFS